MRPTSDSELRKGLWTEEEDILLKNCIAKYGEGKWHLVPIRAGLNRCRKSCRLRWLNYLKPDIKRGDFGADEVDLIIRLHKLLGNRWSLIAGRLPGRTANDVKNYWNTHLLKKTVARRRDLVEMIMGGKEASNNINACRGKSTIRPIASTVVVKPRPRAFSKNDDLLLIKGKTAASMKDNNNIIQRTIEETISPVNKYSPPAPTSAQNDDKDISNSTSTTTAGIQYWWDNLLLVDNDQAASPSPSPSRASLGWGSGSAVENDMTISCLSPEQPSRLPLPEVMKDGGSTGDDCCNHLEGLFGSNFFSSLADSESWDQLVSDLS